MSNLEKKFGKYAIKNLTLYLIAGYVIGYVIQIIGRMRGIDFTNFLTLDPIRILQGQVWRIISWVIIPPGEYSGFQGMFFIALMMYCCYSIGTVLERTWGTFKYNMFLFGGILITVLSSFLSLFIIYLLNASSGITLGYIIKNCAGLFNNCWYYYSTYYINMSIYIGFALTFPNNMVRFMFFIPMKMKWLGIIDGLYFLYELGMGIYYFYLGYYEGLILISAVLAALINIFIFWLINIKRFNPASAARRAKFKSEYNNGARKASGDSGRAVFSQRSSSSMNNHSAYMRGGNITRHKCAVCGQSEKDNPDLEFRFCSKCNGAYEYCQNHLFTHVHKN